MDSTDGLDDVMEDEGYTLDEISDDITAATDLIDEHLQAIRRNTAATAKWVRSLTLGIFFLVLLNFIAVLLAL